MKIFILYLIISLLLILIFGIFLNSNNTGEQILKTMRYKMVAEQIESRGITDNNVLLVMRKVKRHLFVPKKLWPQAYNDSPLPIGSGQTISQPYIVALMTESLKLKGHEKVLEIGTGSGYQAAVLAELSQKVYTIEIVKALAESSKKKLKNFGYTNITVIHGDGYMGLEKYSPFDRIIVTCAPPYIPESLKQQLNEGGRMIIPVGEYYQELKLLTKKNNKIHESSIIPVRFVPMTGGNINH